MEKVVQFLEMHWDQKSPLLLGFSGGADSLALLHILLEWNRAPIHLAHVDHGWRQSSEAEAHQLQSEAKKWGLPFHTIRLKKEGNGNFEEKARKERLQFFQSLFEKIPFQALLLAHQREDLAETTMKRVFEGAHLPFLGMKASTEMEKMSVWRPLLGVKRSEILQFIEKRNLTALDDPTNRDPLYLRARMRLSIFPFLNETFGKNISENLAQLGERAEELKAYLDKKISAHPVFKGPWGLCFSLESLEKIEARHLLQKYLSLPRHLLEKILNEKPANWQVTKNLYVDREWVFILADPSPRFEAQEFPVQPGEFQWGDWKVKIEPSNEVIDLPDWKRVWSGFFSVGVNQGASFLCLPEPGNHCRKVWTEKRVPPFLRFQIPVVIQKGKVIQEFLSGKRGSQGSSDLKITFSHIASN